MPFAFPTSSRLLGVVALCLSVSAPAFAATLKDALDHAWAASAATQTARTQQFDADDMAARAWLPGPPTVSVSGKTDQLDRNDGLREWEAEVAVPLWLWGQRERAAAVAQAGRTAGAQRFMLERWQLAGALRDAWWDTRLAQAELDAARRKLDAANRLETDAGKRLKAGDISPFDANLARLSRQQSQAELLRATMMAAKAESAFAALSRGAALPEPQETDAPANASLDTHPQLLSLIATVAAARARLQQAGGDTRDNPELALTVTRERSGNSEAYQNLAKLTLKLPLGTETRNRPRVAAANAELAEAEQALETAHIQVRAAYEASRLELDQARSEQALQQERQLLAEQNLLWQQQANRAGQVDLAALLRAQAEADEARLQVTRARINVGRMISRTNQAAGVLP
ncbi:Outer membrane efflux protein [Andreprevotia lacus DSM 23236]|jgi:cobalt-zinc-cadmium efflux system outer membrane protein|uniref:Outer membrane efflux protein n=1 Tax=Andreprevotia lacus DSM 23236 TaxID=1121001 RepID=A0A1W1Y0W3_9NEIS|nr:TolC family protein [Andreprevotia lacus]SMC29398.1 Outer membrane efflux protein [Andreprevotia lacus DSM 23236]